MAVIDPTTAIGRVRLMIGDAIDPETLPDSVYSSLLTKYSDNEMSAAREAAIYICAILSQQTHQRLDRIEIYGGEAFTNYMTFLDKFINNAVSSLSAAGVYCGGIDKEDYIANLEDTTTRHVEVVDPNRKYYGTLPDRELPSFYD